MKNPKPLLLCKLVIETGGIGKIGINGGTVARLLHVATSDGCAAVFAALLFYEPQPLYFPNSINIGINSYMFIFFG